MKNKANLKKWALIVVSAMLLVCVSVGATVAYLTATKTVKNTFTVGNVQIKLDETDIGKNDGSRTETGNTYKIFPGQTYTKDPTVTFIKGSEDSYVRMKVSVTNIDKLKSVFTDESYYANGIFLLEKLVNDWDSTIWKSFGYTEAEEDGKTVGTYEFRYYEKVKTTTDNDLILEPLFKEIQIPESVNNVELATLGEVSVNITAEAIQAEGFADADAAWKKF